MFLLGTGLWAAERKAGDPHFELPAVGDKPAAPVFAPAQLAYVQSWIRQQVPECPVEASGAVAQDFLESLQQREPDKLDRLLTSDFSPHQYEAMLFRSAGARLTAPSQQPLREKVAGRRVAAILAREGRTGLNAGEQLAKLRDTSDFQYRRLLDGRMEDDELLLLLKKSGTTEAAPRVAGPVQPKVLTAAEIVSEFARRNQAGSAQQRLQAYAVEGQLTTATGEVQHVVINRMRPDRFRLDLLTGGLAKYILAADNDRFWQQVPGQPYQVAAGKDMGERRYLAEFSDPLFARDGYAFELLPEGASGGKKVFRIGVARPDGSRYVALIEQETFHEVGREEPNRAIARYSDFRDVAGVTFAFREEISDPQGRRAVMVISRITPNPGLIQEYFHPATEEGLDYFQLQSAVRRGPGPALSSP